MHTHSSHKLLSVYYQLRSLIFYYQLRSLIFYYQLRSLIVYYQLRSLISITHVMPGMVRLAPPKALNTSIVPVMPVCAAIAGSRTPNS